MSKYLITGRQGSGKTTIIKQLQKLGYTAYNTDDLPDVTKLQDRETIEWPEGKVDWSRYAWNWQKPEIEKLLASDEVVFIGAVVSNQLDFYPMFDKVFVITVSGDTLKTSLETHEHSSHHLPGEIDRITNDHEKKQALFINEGAEPVSGERSTEEIANDILRLVGLK